MLWRKLILEEHGLDIEYIQSEKNRAADVLSRLPNNGNKETTHESTYKTETILELFNIEETPEGKLTLYFKLIDCYKREDPILTEKLTCIEYKEGSFCGGRNTIKLLTYKNKIIIPQ